MSGTSLKARDCTDHYSRSVPKPLVSVVVPTSNRADYLEVTLASLAAQDLDGDYEEIAIDDGSHDRTPAVIEAAGVRVVRRGAPEGPDAARETGGGPGEAGLV